MKVVQQCRWLILLILGALILTGCETPITYQQQYDDAQKQACNVQRQIAQERLNSSVVQVHNQFYANDVYHSGDNPLWLASRINLRGNNIPLEMLMNKVVPTNAVGVQYGEGANKDQLITINYSGSVRGALDKIAAETSYSYDIESNMLTWSPYVTKTFDVSFMPGTSQYLVGQKQGDSMFNTTGSSNNTASGQQNDSQFSSLEGNVSVWNDLQSSIQQMLSPDGKVMVSQSTTTVTVHDHPQNVQDVADYLASMNRDLSKEVLLQVHVYQVSLDKNFNFGINWNLAYQTAAQAGFGTGNVSQPLSQSPLGSSAPGGPIFSAVAGAVTGNLFNTSGIPGISAGVVSGPFANSQLLINALQQQGTVSNVTNPEVVTLNNQVAQIDISTQTTYLASSTTTLTAGASATNSGFAQTSLNPGVVDTGFKLYILPKIMNGNVYLEVSSELSSLDSLNTITSQGSSIQLPVISGKHFNLRSLVPNASTLIIGGFKTVDSTSAHNSEFGVFGGSGADQSNKETILLITPTVLGNNS
jgi:MSHA biogenesis protein MshL